MMISLPTWILPRLVPPLLLLLLLLLHSSNVTFCVVVVVVVAGWFHSSLIVGDQFGALDAAQDENGTHLAAKISSTSSKASRLATSIGSA